MTASPSPSSATISLMMPLRGITKLLSARVSAVRERRSSAAANETKGADMLVPEVPSPLVRKTPFSVLIMTPVPGAKMSYAEP